MHLWLNIYLGIPQRHDSASYYTMQSRKKHGDFQQHDTVQCNIAFNNWM